MPNKKLAGVPTAHNIFLQWCKANKITPKGRPIDPFDLGAESIGTEYVLDPHIRLVAGKGKQPLLFRTKNAWFTVRFSHSGKWIGGTMMLWGKNPWERVK